MKKLDRNDPETKSADMLSSNIEHLRELFPEAFTEGKIDFEVLKQILGDALDEREEKYGLNWHGKRRARQIALTPSTGTLRPCPADSMDWDKTQNLMIEGDNLEVLKLLQKSYAGKVKLIYLDPPYNTGRDFVYPDNYQDSIKNYLDLTGQVQGGQKLSSNFETSGRFHTAWLNMIYPRIKSARSLLREDGVIVISIDDTELADLRLACSEIFGEENQLAILIHQRAKGGGNAKQVVKGHDYMLVYAKNIEQCPPLRRDKVVQGEIEVVDGVEYLIDDDVLRKTFGKYDRENGDRRCFYEQIVEYKGLEKKKEIDEKIKKGELFLRLWEAGVDVEKGMHVICKRTRLDEATSKLYSIISTVPENSILKVLSEAGKKDLEELGLDGAFSYPKPKELLVQIIRSATSTDSLVLDFFAGSGTAGHAVMAQNVADGGNRNYILVQLPELLDPENKDQKIAADYCDKLKKPRNIAELTKERLRRARKEIKEENPTFAGDLGFRVFKLDSSNIQAWEPKREELAQSLEDHARNLKTDRTEQDILYELLLKLGLDLTVPIEEKVIAGKTVHSIGVGTLFACLAEAVSRKDVEPLAQGIVAWHKELAPAGESQVVFKDSAFVDDVAKTNLTAILQQSGLENVRSL